jgi:hypothetical protein
MLWMFSRIVLKGRCQWKDHLLQRARFVLLASTAQALFLQLSLGIVQRGRFHRVARHLLLARLALLENTAA